MRVLLSIRVLWPLVCMHSGSSSIAGQLEGRLTQNGFPRGGQCHAYVISHTSHIPIQPLSQNRPGQHQYLSCKWHNKTSRQTIPPRWNAYIITYHTEQTMSYFTFHLSRNLHIDYILISFSMFSDLNLSLTHTQLEKSTIIRKKSEYLTWCVHTPQNI